MGPNFWERRRRERWGGWLSWWRLPIRGSFGGDGGSFRSFFVMGFDLLMNLEIRRIIRREMKKMNVVDDDDEKRDGVIDIVVVLG